MVCFPIQFIKFLLVWVFFSFVDYSLFVCFYTSVIKRDLGLIADRDRRRGSSGGIKLFSFLFTIVITGDNGGGCGIITGEMVRSRISGSIKEVLSKSGFSTEMSFKSSSTIDKEEEERELESERSEDSSERSFSSLLSTSKFV
jgi:hypothetical protein